jgi:hypothetical protein
MPTKLRRKRCPCGSRRPQRYVYAQHVVEGRVLLAMALRCPACGFEGRPGLGKVTLTRRWNEAVHANG